MVLQPPPCHFQMYLSLLSCSLPLGCGLAAAPAQSFRANLGYHTVPMQRASPSPHLNIPSSFQVPSTSEFCLIATMLQCELYRFHPGTYLSSAAEETSPFPGGIAQKLWTALPHPAAPFVTSFPAVWILEETGNTRRKNIKGWTG